MNADIVFIIPAFNEHLIIGQAAELLRAECEKSFGETVRWQIVIAENGSSDDTLVEAGRVAEQSQGKIIALSCPTSGRARALRQACEAVPADVYCYLDADLPMDLKDIKPLVERVRRGEADLVVARRAGDRPLKRRVLSFGFRTLNQWLFGLQVHDAQCGVKVWSKRVIEEVFPLCHETGYFFDTELLALTQHHGMRVEEFPIQWIEQRFPERSSKVRPVKDTLAAFRSLATVSHRLYPDVSHAVLLVVLFGLATLAVFFEQLLIVVPGHFQVPNQYADHPWQVVLNVLAGAGVYLTLGFLLYRLRLKSLPWKFVQAIAAGFFILILVVAIATQPTRSQDLYWNLNLVHGWTEYGMNPYITTPSMLPVDAFTEPVREWKHLSMTHGPLYVYIVATVTTFVDTVTAGLIGLKTLQALALIAAIVFILKTVRLRGWSAGEEAVACIVLLFNPLLLQMAVVDGHNDVWIFLSVAASLYFLQQKWFAASAVALIAGAFVKYVTVLFFPVPVVALLWSGLAWRMKLRQLLWIGVGGILGVCLYIPFGMPWNISSGLNEELTARGSYTASLLPTVLLHKALGWEVADLRLLGVSIALIVLAMLLARRQFIHAFFWPVILMLSIGTPWVQAWYLLWIIPSCVVLGAIPTVLLLSSIVYLISDVIFAIHIIIILIIPLTLVLIRELWRRLK